MDDYRISRRRLLGAAAMTGGILTVPGLLAACGGQESGTGGTGGSDEPLTELTVALPSSISTLDVTKEAGLVNLVVALLAQEALTTIGPDGSLQPGLATAWDQPSPTEYVYTLRSDVTFSDGEPLTAADVVASIEQHSAEGSTSAFAYAFTNVVRVEATGDHEVTIELSSPDSLLSWALSPGTLQVTSAAFLEEHGDAVGGPSALILGTGPFRVTEFSADSHVALERNERWWGPAPEVESVRVEFVPDESTRLIAMRQGSFDVATTVPSGQLPQWEGIDGVELATATDNSVVTLAFNTSQAPFDDRHVRAAIAHAVDREAVVSSVLRGNAEVAATFPTPSTWGGLLEPAEVEEAYDSIVQYGFDLDAARAELAQSSVPDGFSTTVSYPNSGPEIGRALLTLAENLREIGIDLTVREATLEQWIADLGNDEAGLVLGWYFATTGDPAEYAQQLLSADNAGDGGTNIARYRNDDVTDLLRREREESDPAERGRLLSQALIEAAQDVPYQPLWWGQSTAAFGPRVALDTEYSPYFFLGSWAAQVSVRQS